MPPLKRNAKGQYAKGTSGNMLGRPVRRVRENTPEEIRADFFEVANSPVTITQGGKRKTITASQAITRQLARLASTGDRPAILLWTRLEEKYAAEEMREMRQLMEQVFHLEQEIRNSPEDFTDEEVNAVQQVRQRLSRIPQRR